MGRMREMKSFEVSKSNQINVWTESLFVGLNTCFLNEGGDRKDFLFPRIINWISVA